MANSYWDKMFNEIDKNGNGKIELQELSVYLKKKLKEENKKKIENEFKSFDLNEDGVVTKKEFSQVMEKAVLQVDEFIRDVFKTFDTDKSGYLSKAELEQALRSLGIDINSANIQASIQSATKDGKVDHNELLSIILS